MRTGGNATKRSSASPSSPACGFLSIQVAPSKKNPLRGKVASSGAAAPISAVSSSSSSDCCPLIADACRVAVRKASGKKRPPNQRGNLWKVSQACSALSCSTRCLKSDSHSVTVMPCGTGYFRQLGGMLSVFMFSAKALFSLVVLAVPRHSSSRLLKSFVIFFCKPRPTSTSLSKHLHRGSLTATEDRCIGAKVLGRFWSIVLTLPSICVNQFPALAAMTADARRPVVFFLPLSSFLRSSLLCSDSHPLSVCTARLIRIICSAWTGRPAQAGLPFTGKASIQVRNCSLFRASGDISLCSADTTVLSEKSLLKDSSRKRC
mmetsp:Transcript_1153/g.2473  ORF Transcript_1153/g.2473 Transcript_1153/m.2473 type:complete len:319 (-) Transcript_1153:1752-2708(-)